jgi:ribosomal protein S27E
VIEYIVEGFYFGVNLKLNKRRFSEMATCPSCHEKVGLFSLGSNGQKQLVCKICGATVAFTIKSRIILAVPFLLFMVLGIFLYKSGILPETLFENPNAVATRGFRDNTPFAVMYILFGVIWGTVWGHKFSELKIVKDRSLP